MPATRHFQSPNHSFLSPSTRQLKPKRSPPRLKRSKRIHSMLKFCDISKVPASTPSIDPFQTPQRPLDFTTPLPPLLEAEPPMTPSSPALSLEDWTPKTKRLVQLASPSPPPKKPIGFEEALSMSQIALSLENAMLHE
ncbi:hypothetical protein H4R22_005064 [Coemansia sp. RSA 1290]|nr:hypothetical protein H4R22_005064 [Coemansia sp. RSA 1290]